ncbi:MAG: HipA domain-containing protein [Thiolinea sp.]
MLDRQRIQISINKIPVYYADGEFALPRGGAASVLPDQKYTKDGGPNLAAIFRLIDQYASVPARDRLKVLDWVVFNYLVGNADAHGKNLAILLTAGNKMQLAPIYDVLCTAVYPNLDTRMAMPIGGEYRPAWVQQRHWQRFAEESNINLAFSFCGAHLAPMRLAPVRQSLQV